jgi:hypothetical protein
MSQVLQLSPRSITFDLQTPASGEIPKPQEEIPGDVRKPRAIYDSIFPPLDPVSERQDRALASHTVGGANAYRSDGVLRS